jgi:hypothetical protein
MNMDKLFNLLGAIVVVAAITAAVLPGRQTPQVISALGGAFSGSIKAAVGN